MTDTKRWRGLKDIVRDAVTHGTTAIERVHLETSRRPFAVLEQLPTLSKPVATIHQLHDTVVSTGYTSVRTVTAVVDRTLDTGLDLLEARTPAAEDDDRG
ncbi:MAG: hypothetical protein OXT09_37290 [Myxococcales bacterium]|nr:hypothetical protein [Myxococcales bacterium]